jgi:hypothetical protein
MQTVVNQVMQDSMRAQKRLDALFMALTDPANGRVIHLPNGQTDRIAGPSIGDVAATHTDVLRHLLQSQRLIIALVTGTSRFTAAPAAAGNGTRETHSHTDTEHAGEAHDREANAVEVRVPIPGAQAGPS